MKFTRILILALGLLATGVIGAGVTYWQLSQMEEDDFPAATGFSGNDIASIEGIVKSYLLANPEIVRDAFRELEARDERRRVAEAASLVADNAEKIFREAGAIVLGNPEGDITLVEFTDYNCPFCKRSVADVKKLIAGDANLRVVIKEFPILGDGSVEAARVSLAVAKQSRYYEFHQKLFDVRGQKNGAKALAIAEELGLDMDKLSADMKSAEVEKTIADTLDLASVLRIQGTPAFVVGNEIVPGAVGYAALADRIAAARKTN
ncbi:MAG: DsbA family protein [Hyphomicrobiales bacterium]